MTSVLVRNVQILRILIAVAALAGCQSPLLREGFAKRKEIPTTGAMAATEAGINQPSTFLGNAQETGAQAFAQAQQQSMTPSMQIGSELAKGQSALAANDYSTARIHLETALQTEPNNGHAHHLLARVSDQQQRFEEAERHYLTALSSRPQDANLLSDLGYSYFLQGKYDQAREYLNRALVQQPGHRVALVNLGAVAAEQGDSRQALAYFRQVGNEQQAEQLLAGVLNKKLARQSELARRGALASQEQMPQSFQELADAMNRERQRAKQARSQAEHTELELEMLRRSQAELSASSALPPGQLTAQDTVARSVVDPNINSQLQRLDAEYQIQRRALLGQSGAAPIAATSNHSFAGYPAQGQLAFPSGQQGSSPFLAERAGMPPTRQFDPATTPQTPQQSPAPAGWSQGIPPSGPDGQFDHFSQNQITPPNWNSAVSATGNSNWQQPLPPNLNTQSGNYSSLLNQNQGASTTFSTQPGIDPALHQPHSPGLNPASRGPNPGLWSPDPVAGHPDQAIVPMQYQQTSQSAAAPQMDPTRQALQLGMSAGPGSLFQFPPGTGATGIETRRPTLAGSTAAPAFPEWPTSSGNPTSAQSPAPFVSGFQAGSEPFPSLPVPATGHPFDPQWPSFGAAASTTGIGTGAPPLPDATQWRAMPAWPNSPQ